MNVTPCAVNRRFAYPPRNCLWPCMQVGFQLPTPKPHMPCTERSNFSGTDGILEIGLSETMLGFFMAQMGPELQLNFKRKLSTSDSANRTSANRTRPQLQVLRWPLVSVPSRML